MKVSELIERLETLPQDVTVVVASDEEGNSFGVLEYVDTMHMDFTDPYRPELVEDEDTGEWKEEPINVVRLWP